VAARTVDWNASQTGAPTSEGLRERKKRLMRQQLTDTATEMFMQRGFDAFRVSEVAEVCGVSEKTVFNYFSTKESLVLDRLDSTMASLREAFLEVGGSSLEVVLRVLDDELDAHTTWLASRDDPVEAAATFQRFRDLVDATPSLRAYESDMIDRLIDVVAQLLAERLGMMPSDPEPQIAATALVGLWRVQRQAMRRYLDGTRAPAVAHKAIGAAVDRAAQLINNGLTSFTPRTTKRRPEPPAATTRRRK